LPACAIAHRKTDTGVESVLGPPHWRDAHPALAAALDLTSDAVYFVTPGTLQICGANAAAAARTGYEPSELLFMRLTEVFEAEGLLIASGHTDDPSDSSSAIPRDQELPSVTRAVERSKVGCAAAVDIQWQNVEADGESLLVAVVRDSSSAALASIGAEREPRDHLTSLHGRACLTSWLRDADERTDEERGRLALLFVDVDAFKQINDAHGHLVGDRVLQTIATRIVACVRPDDLVVRYGGDEFVVLLQGVLRQEQVEHVVARISAEIALPIVLASGLLHVSASIGLAIGREAVSAADLLDEADQSMYRAKRARCKPR